jgi:hypothetical protein
MSEGSRFMDDRKETVKPLEFDRRKKRGLRLTTLCVEYTSGNIGAVEQELLSVSILPHCKLHGMLSLWGFPLESRTSLFSSMPSILCHAPALDGHNQFSFGREKLPSGKMTLSPLVLSETFNEMCFIRLNIFSLYMRDIMQ